MKNMDEKYDYGDWREILRSAEEELDKNNKYEKFNNNIYYSDDNDIEDDKFIPDDEDIRTFEQLKEYVYDRVDSIYYEYYSDYFKENALKSVFRRIYKFSLSDQIDEFEKEAVIQELKDYIYDTLRGEVAVSYVDEIAYNEIVNKGRSR